ncbi:vacuolar sorting receptor [Salix suchowensis]|nr:vacuolar sorting receptor [Salix suchowensis]
MTLTVSKQGRLVVLTLRRRLWNNAVHSSKDYEFKTLGGHDAVLNVCRAVQHETWGLKTEDPAEVAGFIRRDHGDFSIGRLRATTTIKFVCDSSVFSAGVPRFEAQFPEDDDTACGFFIEWRSHPCSSIRPRNCDAPTNTIHISALILVMIYLVVGTLHNRFVLQLQGFDQVPQFSITSMTYHARHAIDWLREAIATGSFHMPNPSATNPVSHQSSVQGMPHPRHPRTTNRSGRPETNPFSHQSQVGLGSSAQLDSTKVQTLPQSQRRRFDLESGGSQEEREHILGVDEGLDEQELVDVPKKLETSPQPPSTTDQSDVADVRGRGSGTDGVIRL